MSSTASGERTAKRTVALGFGAVVASVLLVMTAVIASTYTAQRVAINARALHWANAALGTAAISRASINQAIFFGIDQGLGVASEEAVGVAVDSAQSDLASTRHIALGAADGAYTPPPALAGLIGTYANIATLTLDLVASGEASAAADLKALELDPAFTELTTALSDQQRIVAGAISDTETLAGRIDTVTRIGIMLALPLFAFIIYRRRAKKSMEAARRRHANELEVERRSATAKDEFFAAVSHELRTPLTTILGFSEVLMDGSARPDEQAELVALIRSDAIDLERRIDDLVAAARSASHGLNTSTVEFEVESVLQSMTEVIPTEKTFVVEAQEATVRADPIAVKQIVRNLVSNAERHGGSRMWIAGRIMGNQYMVIVGDDGEGFDPAALDASTGPFAHDHREAILNGTIGLGLTAAVALASANGGHLAYRRVSGWTQVAVFLPLAITADPAEIESPQPESEQAESEQADFQEALIA